MKEELEIKLSLEEINLIFKSLGNLPFKEVYELVGKINVQVNAQLKGDKIKSINENGFVVH